MQNLLLILLLLVSGAHRAAADCQCPSLTAKEQTDQATYVFNADVWDVAFDNQAGRRVITLDVNDTFKGDPKQRLEVRDERSGTECAIDFKEGESYLVFARWQ